MHSHNNSGYKMTRSTPITICWLLLLLVMAACSKPGQNSASESSATSTASPLAPRITSESVVKVAAQPVEIPAGGSVGFFTYPKALNTKFPFAEKPLAVYEGETGLKTTLNADKGAKPGQRSISAK